MEGRSLDARRRSVEPRASVDVRRVLLSRADLPLGSDGRGDLPVSDAIGDIRSASMDPAPRPPAAAPPPVPSEERCSLGLGGVGSTLCDRWISLRTTAWLETLATARLSVAESGCDGRKLTRRVDKIRSSSGRLMVTARFSTQREAGTAACAYANSPTSRSAWSHRHGSACCGSHSSARRAVPRRAAIGGAATSTLSSTTSAATPLAHGLTSKSYATPGPSAALSMRMGVGMARGCADS